MASERDKLSDQIRAAIDADGRSRYRICKLLDIDQATMHRFMAGGGMHTAKIDAVAHLLGLSVKRPAGRRAAGGE